MLVTMKMLKSFLSMHFATFNINLTYIILGDLALTVFTTIKKLISISVYIHFYNINKM